MTDSNKPQPPSREIEYVTVTDSIEACISTNEVGSPRAVSDARAQLAYLVDSIHSLTTECADLTARLAEAQQLLKYYTINGSVPSE
jgi:hypothetical protein